ncbi:MULTISPECIES: terminase large subunit domain-containing protein [unclassified Maridesulfovibrio]|uniref:terminase large subunit domain-containing protein n=1 Tax=unclassified Maridesulfovibrio TaxID=2794999 RepID=UPI003B3C404D
MSKMPQKVVIPYSPRILQRQVYRDQRPYRFSVEICHRRFGKTVMSVNKLIRRSIQSELPDCFSSYIAPLYRQAKAVAWPYLKYYLWNYPGISFNEAELKACFPRDSKGRQKVIQLLGANNPDSLRGLYFDGVIFDEIEQMPWNTWTEIVRPALADRKGWADFIGTPKGKNVLWKLYQRAKNDPNWFAALYRASETGILDPEELEAMKADMSPEEYEQEMECSFMAAIKGAFFGRLMADAERDKRIANVSYDSSLPVHTSWDLGMSDSTSIWFVQAYPGGKYAVIDYYEASGEGLDHYANVLSEKPYSYGRHIAPHDIRVRELGTGKSRLEVARSLGIRFDVAPNIPVQDGINAVRTMIPNCHFDQGRCDLGIEALLHYRRQFKEKAGDFAAKPLHDWSSHAVDAFRYFAVGFREDRRRGPRQTHTINSHSSIGLAGGGHRQQARAESNLWSM